jgi:hypothetical protein
MGCEVGGNGGSPARGPGLRAGGPPGGVRWVGMEGPRLGDRASGPEALVCPAWA